MWLQPTVDRETLKYRTLGEVHVYTHAHVRKKCQLPHARNQSVRKGTRLAAPLVFFEGSLESLVLGLILKAFLYNRLTDYYNNIPIKFNQVLNSERSSLID